MLLTSWRSIAATRPLLVVVPRHPQRFEAVAELIANAGFSLSRRSAWPGDERPAAAADAEVWLGDSMLEMPAWYALADVALLGGSFAPLGGQNLIEAAACGCPVVMGPHTFNFTDAAELALAAGAATRVADMAAGVAAAVDARVRVVGTHARRALATRLRFRKRSSRRCRAHGDPHRRRPRRSSHEFARRRKVAVVRSRHCAKSPGAHQRHGSDPRKGAPTEPAPPSRREGSEAGREQSCQKRSGAEQSSAPSDIPLYLTSNASIPRMSDGTKRPEAWRSRNVPSSKSYRARARSRRVWYSWLWALRTSTLTRMPTR